MIAASEIGHDTEGERVDGARVNLGAAPRCRVGNDSLRSDHRQYQGQ